MSGIYWIVGGVLLLITGRKLYWFFVAVMGFMVGLTLSAMYIKADVPWVHWLIAIGCGFLGGILAVGLQKLAVGVAGFIAGGYGLVFFLELIGVNLGNTNWPFILVGGVIGAILVVVVFEYALIVLSSVAGATLISRSVALQEGLSVILFLGLVLLGCLLQWAGLRLEEKSETS